MNSEDDDKGNGDDCGAGISINSMTRSGVTALSSLMACSRLVSALCYSCLVTMTLYLKPRAPFGLLDTAKGCSVARCFVLKGHRCCTVTATADTISTLRTSCTQRPCHNSERQRTPHATLGRHPNKLYQTRLISLLHSEHRRFERHPMSVSAFWGVCVCGPSEGECTATAVSSDKCDR